MGRSEVKVLVNTFFIGLTKATKDSIIEVHPLGFLPSLIRTVRALRLERLLCSRTFEDGVVLSPPSLCGESGETVSRAAAQAHFERFLASCPVRVDYD